MSLIDVLKQEHQQINKLLQEVKELGVHTTEGQDKLLKSKHLILSHLKKEDEKLYPELKRLEEARDISNSFQEEMKGISQVVLAFFNKYENNLQVNIDFHKDFGNLVGKLKVRIQREELMLYAKYEQYVN